MVLMLYIHVNVHMYGAHAWHLNVGIRSARRWPVMQEGVDLSEMWQSLSGNYISVLMSN